MDWKRGACRRGEENLRKYTGKDTYDVSSQR
jgi:hypothetical protein